MIGSSPLLPCLTSLYDGHDSLNANLLSQSIISHQTCSANAEAMGFNHIDTQGKILVGGGVGWLSVGK